MASQLEGVEGKKKSASGKILTTDCSCKLHPRQTQIGCEHHCTAQMNQVLYQVVLDQLVLYMLQIKGLLSRNFPERSPLIVSMYSTSWSSRT